MWYIYTTKLASFLYGHNSSCTFEVINKKLLSYLLIPELPVSYNHLLFLWVLVFLTPAANFPYRARDCDSLFPVGGKDYVDSGVSGRQSSPSGLSLS